MSVIRWRSFVTASALVAGALVGIEAAQSGRTQVRDLRTEATGTAVISGIVQNDEATPRPLRRALVRLSGDQLMTARQTWTRDDGRFEFAGLSAGQYTLTAARASYAGTEYGARRPGGAGSPIELGNGQRLTDVVLRLARFGSISGVIYDQDGAPAAGVSVEAMRYTMRTGRRSLSSVYGQPATTDDRGVYRLGGLLPGEYYVAAGPSPDRGPTDVQRLTVADIDRALQILNAPGEASAAPIAFSEPHQGFAPVFFPGSPELARAQPIVLTLGEERAGIDIRLQLVPTARVDGTVAGLDGQPIPGTQIVATAVTEAFSMDLFSAGTLGVAPVDAQGRFSYPAVPPGRYVITGRASSTATGPLWAAADISVGGADQTVALTLQPGMTVSGRIAFDGRTLQPPATMAGMRVTLRGAETAPGVTIAVTPATANADGTFTITGVPPGSYRLMSTVPPGPADWALRSATVNGVDALDVPLSIAPNQHIDNVVVTFTDRPTELAGNLQAPSGTPTADCFIIVFATDRSFWVPSTRRSVMARPATTGRYVVRNLPPGEYFVAAVTDVEQGDWFDPQFLERLVPAALRVTLAEGEKRTLDLKLGGG